jgi:hypothetical protein
MAEVEKTTSTSQEPQFLTYTGRLDMAGDVAVTFQLASEGKLGVKLLDTAPTFQRASAGKLGLKLHDKAPTFQLPSARKLGVKVHDKARGHCPIRSKEIEDAVRGWTSGGVGMGRISRADRRKYLCQPPSRGICKRVGRAQRMRRLPKDICGPAEDALAMCEKNEEILQGEWASLGSRHASYAVIALDNWETVHLMANWPDKQNHTHVEDEAAGIVAAAHRKGQGLLFTVEQR